MKRGSREKPEKQTLKVIVERPLRRGMRMRQLGKLSSAAKSRSWLIIHYFKAVLTYEPIPKQPQNLGISQ